MVCRGLMLALDRAGHIALPPIRQRPPNPFLMRAQPERVAIDETPIGCTLGEVSLREVRRTEEEKLCCGLIETHHYLKYTQPVGEHLKYIAYDQNRPIACFTWSSAPQGASFGIPSIRKGCSHVVQGLAAQVQPSDRLR